MRPVGYLLVLSAAAAMAAAAPQTFLRLGSQAGGGLPKFICDRTECSCEQQGGFELVTCDCSKAGSGEVSFGSGGDNMWAGEENCAVEPGRPAAAMFGTGNGRCTSDVKPSASVTAISRARRPQIGPARICFQGSVSKIV